MSPAVYEVVSADSHVIEPHDLWRRYIDPAFRDQAPRLVHDADTDRLEFAAAEMPPVGLLAGCARRDEETRLEGRWDTDVFAGGYDPDARVQEAEADGIAAEVLFPTLGMHLYPIADPALRWAMFRAYNTWLADFCSAHPDRLQGIGMLLHEDVDEAVDELRRCRELGLVGVMVPLDVEEEHAHHLPRHDPLWAAAQELAMPVNLHTATTRVKAKAWNTGTATFGTMKTLRVIAPLLDMVYTGLFDRFPDLMIVSSENDAGWAPYVADHADFWWRRNRRVYSGGDQVVCRHEPSHYLRTNVRYTFMRDVSAIAARHVIGTEALLWGSDFPHHVSTWPESRQVLDDHLAEVPDDERDRIVSGNVRALYGF